MSGEGRRDRTGEVPIVHDEADCDGWLGEDVNGRPIPCTSCRPTLAPARLNRHRWRRWAIHR